MTLFEQGAEVDLTDEGLYSAWEAEMADMEAEAKGKEEAAVEEGQAVEQKRIPVAKPARGTPEAGESRWQQAVADVSRQWPEMQGKMEAVVKRMTEISQRYGDSGLWQQHPAGIMREAALELFGPPSKNISRAVRAAAAAARKAALREAELRHQEKIGLSLGKSRRSDMSPLSEEEKLIRAMASAKSRGIF